MIPCKALEVAEEAVVDLLLLLELELVTLEESSAAAIPAEPEKAGSLFWTVFSESPSSYAAKACP